MEDQSEIFDRLQNVSSRTVNDLKASRNAAIDSAYNKLIDEYKEHYTTIENVYSDVAHVSGESLALIGAIQGVVKGGQDIYKKLKGKRDQIQEQNEDDEANENEDFENAPEQNTNENFEEDEAAEGFGDVEDNEEGFGTLDDLDLDDFGPRGPPPAAEDAVEFSGKSEIFAENQAEPTLQEPAEFNLDTESFDIQDSYRDIMGDANNRPLFSSDFETTKRGEGKETEDGFETAPGQTEEAQEITSVGRNFDSESELDKLISQQDLDADSDFKVLPRNTEPDTDFEAFGEQDVQDLVQDLQEGTTESRFAQFNLGRGMRPFAGIDENVDPNLPAYRMGTDYGQQYSVRGGETEMTQFRQRAPETETEVEPTDIEPTDIEPTEAITEATTEGTEGKTEGAAEGGEIAGEVAGEIGGEAAVEGAEIAGDVALEAVGSAADATGVGALVGVPLQIVGGIGLLAAIGGGIYGGIQTGKQLQSALESAGTQEQQAKSASLPVGGMFSANILSNVNTFR